MKVKGFIIPLSIIYVAIMCISCTVNNVKDGDNGSSDASLGIEKKYLKEGFISEDVYRIVIVSTKDESADDPGAIQSKAKRKALASLGKYIVSNDRNYDNNVRALLLNMINQNGQFSKQDFQHNNNDIYYFDIKKNNIKKYLMKVSSPR